MNLYNKITEPTLLLNKQICLLNIRRMKQKADKNNVQFRPHFKTHQSVEIGEWFRQEGVLSISVSSLKMARYFAEAGWDDITLAFPVNIREASQINELAGKIKLNLLFIHEETWIIILKIKLGLSSKLMPVITAQVFLLQIKSKLASCTDL